MKRPAVIFAAAAVVAALLVSVLLLFEPASTNFECVVTADEEPFCVTTTASFVQEHGAAGFARLLLPVLATCACGLLIRAGAPKRYEWLIAGGLLLYALLGILSLGGFFMLPAVLLLIAVVLDERGVRRR